MEPLIKHISEFSGLSMAATERIVSTIIAFLVLWLLRFLILKLIYLRSDEPSVRYFSRKLSFYITILASFLAAVVIWSRDLVNFNLGTFLGLAVGGIAIAIKDLIVNVFAWIYILLSKTFELGDRISIGEATGDVVDRGVFQFVIVEIGNWVPADQSTGRLIHIPNGMIFQHPIANYTRGFNFIWEDIAILLTFESDWRKAKSILEEVAERHTKGFVEDAQQAMKKATSRFFIFYKKLTPIVYTAVKESGVELSVRYVVPPRRRRKLSQLIWEDVLTEFAACDEIDFAYPTYRAYFNAVEGKDGIRKPWPPSSPTGINNASGTGQKSNPGEKSS